MISKGCCGSPFSSYLRIYPISTKATILFCDNLQTAKIFVKTLDKVSLKWYNTIKDRGKPLNGIAEDGRVQVKVAPPTADSEQ